MTARQMQNAFEQEANRMDSDLIVESHRVFYWINEAINRFVKTRYSGNNYKGTSVEQTQKRIDDLNTLVTEVSLNVAAGGGTDNPRTLSYTVELPNNYLFTLSEEVYISIDSPEYPNMQFEKRTGVTQCDSDTYFKKITDPYSEYKLHYESANPLRLFTNGRITLTTDGNYRILSYLLRYLRRPNTVSLEGNDCDLPLHTHSEIVNLAVNLFLENEGDPRYSSNKSELILNE